MNYRVRCFNDRQVIRVYEGPLHNISPIIVNSVLPKSIVLSQVLIDEVLDDVMLSRTEIGTCWLEYDPESNCHFGTLHGSEVKIDKCSCTFSKPFTILPGCKVFILTPLPLQPSLQPIL